MLSALMRQHVPLSSTLGHETGKGRLVGGREGVLLIRGAAQALALSCI